MRAHHLGRQRSVPRHAVPRFRPVVEPLETRVVPSVLDYSAGFAGAGNLTFNGSANVSGSVVQLTDGNLGQAASVFTNSTFDITQFTTTFTFQQSRVPGNSTFADGLTFTIQASPSGPAALGANGEGLGYAGHPQQRRDQVRPLRQCRRRQQLHRHLHGWAGSHGPPERIGVPVPRYVRFDGWKRR